MIGLDILFACLIYAVLGAKLIKDAHRFQQLGYYVGPLFTWTLSHWRTLLAPHDTFFALGVLLALQPWTLKNARSVPLIIVGCALLAAYLYFLKLIAKAYPPKKALVYTPRIKRLLTTTFLLTAAGWAAVYILGTGALLTAVTYGAFLLHMLLLLAGNLVNAPVEQTINNGYAEDALRHMAEAPHLTVVGITGSYGKTTTKNILGAMLAQSFNVLVSPESFNTKMGLTRTLREYLRPIDQIFVAEMGAKAPGDIAELCTFVKPKYGIITSIGPQHLETFKTLDAIVATKGELFRDLAEGGTAFINLDDDHIHTLPLRSDLTKCTFSTSNKRADFYIEDIVLGGEGASFALVQRHPRKRVCLTTKLLGRHNLSNIVAAAAVAITLGVPMEKLAAVISDLKPVPHRLSVRSVGAYTLIDDAFNANPIGSKMALEVLEAYPGNRKIIITPGLIELAEETHVLNARLGKSIADVCDYVILVGASHTRPIQEGLAEKGFPDNQLAVVDSIQEAFAHLNAYVEAGDVVLIENDLPDTFTV